MTKDEQIQKLLAIITVKDEALRKSKQAITWSHPYGGNSCAGEVTFGQSAQWIEDADEAIDTALTSTPQAAKDMVERMEKMENVLCKCELAFTALHTASLTVKEHDYLDKQIVAIQALSTNPQPANKE